MQAREWRGAYGVMTGSGPAAVLGRGIRVFGQAWRQMTAVVALTSAFFVLLCAFSLTALSELAWSQRSIVLDGGRLTLVGAVLLFIEIGLPVLIGGIVTMATMLTALAKLSDDVLTGQPPRVRPALSRGLRRAPALSIGLVAVVGAGLGLLLASPLFVIVGIVGLVGRPIVVLLERSGRPELVWPTVRLSALRCVPFLVPVAMIIRWGLLVPAAALERHSARGALRRSRALVGPGWTAATATLVAVAAFAFATTVSYDAVQRSGAPFALVLALLLVSQLVLAGVPVASVTALFGATSTGTPAGHEITDPPLSPDPHVRATAVVTVVALVVGLGVISTSTRVVAAPAVTHVVDDLGDAADAVPGDGICETAPDSGVCTLRAAIDEANASALVTGVSFDVSGTIRVASPFVVTGPIEIDGAGRYVTVSSRLSGDEPPSSQLFRFTSSVNPFVLANITLVDGVGGVDGGGAVEAVAPASGSVIANVAFASNYSAASGGAVAVLGGELLIQNSTFTSNSSDAAGADIHDLGSTTILYSTLEGAYGATSSIESAGSTTVGSSIIWYSTSPTESACNGVTLGGSNLDRDGSCPGSSRIGDFGWFGDYGGWVGTVEIGHATFAIDRGDAADCARIGSVDARGVARPQGAGCDIGSYEYDGPPSTAAVEVTTDPSPSNLGAPVTVTATVGSTVETLAGTGDVTFSSGGNELATVTLVDGVAEYTATDLTVGSHTFDVFFPGDDLLPPATGSVDHVVSVPSATVAVAVDPSPSALDDEVTLTATVTAPGVAEIPTGDVTFRDGASVVGSAALVDGTATVTTSALGAGERTIHADYVGDSIFPAASGSTSHTVQAPADVRLEGPATSASGESVTFTVHVESEPGLTPVGEVTVSSAGDELFRSTVESDGTASFTTDELAVGSHMLIAAYEGDDGILPAAAEPFEHTVVRAASSTDLVSSVNPSVPGESVTFTATVTVDAPGSATPSGTVTFLDGAGELAVEAVEAVDGSGVATFTTSSLPVGSAVVTARYSGDIDVAPSEDLLAQTVVAGLTDTDLTPSPSPSRLGETVTLTATVSVRSPGSGTPTGSVRFLADGDVLGTAPLGADGEASLAVDSLPIGTYPLTAEYIGDSHFGGSTSDSVDHTVEQWASSVEVVASLAESVTGQEVTFTATVVDVDGGGFDPTGTITFSLFGLSPPVQVALDEDGAATITIPSPLGRGARESLRATYSGSDEFSASLGSTGVDVDPALVDVDITALPVDPYYGQSVVVTVTATPVGPGAGVPRGDFEIYDHGALVRGPADRTGTLVHTFSTPGDLGRFVHELVGRFSGTGWVAAESEPLSVEVRKTPTELDLTVDPSPSVVGRQVTMTARMTVPPGAAPAIGESVTFDDGTDVIGTAPLRFTANGVEASIVTSFATIGEHPLRARFSGPDHEPSTSEVVLHEVGRLPTSVGIGSDSPTLPGDPIEVTVVVSNLSGNASPTGTVILHRDGVLAAAATPLVSAGTGRSSATFTLLVPLPVGRYQFAATYEPSGEFAGGSAEHEHIVAAYLSEVTLDVGDGAVTWGEALEVSAAVTTSTVTNPRTPAGAIVVSDGAGTTCSIAAPRGTCELTWDSPGQRTLTASYEGDNFYGPAESIGRGAEVSRRSSTVIARLDPTSPVAGDPTWVHWEVPASAGGAVHADIAGIRCDGGDVGACVATFPASSAGRAQDVVVVFDGDGLYLPSSATLTVTPLVCHRLQFSGIDPDDGSVAAVTSGNCNDGTGYLPGTTVRVRVTPVDDPAFVWTGVDWDGFGSTRGFDLDIVVGTDVGQVTSVRATLRKAWNCFTVSWLDSETVPNPVVAVGGALAIDQTPNCPVDVNGEPTATGSWERLPGVQRGRFIAGSIIEPVPDAYDGMEFYGFRFGGSRVVVDDDLSIQAVFGPVCIDLDVVAVGPGTASARTASNCSNPVTGLDGYAVGTVVDVAGRADAGAHLTHWEGTDSHFGDEVDVYDDALRARVVEWTSVTEVVGGAAVQPVTAVFVPCSRIEVVARADGSVERDRPGDCPTDDDPELYRTGGTLSLIADARAGVFGRWNVSDDLSDALRAIEVGTDEDLTLRPSFRGATDCVAIDVRVAPGAHAEVHTSGPADRVCLPGELNDGPADHLVGQRFISNPLTFEGTATEGDPLLGWTFTADWEQGGRRSVAGAVATPELVRGALDAVLHTCVAITPEITLIYPDGSTETGGAPPGFIQLADADLDAPDCGFQSHAGAWEVGSSTVLAPLVIDAVEFVRWEGDLDPQPHPDDLVDVTFDGSKPVLTVRGVYRVRCAELTVRDTTRVEVSPAPNCHPEDAPSPTTVGGSYIVGTDIFLRASMPDGSFPSSADRETDDHVWEGWVGDVDGNRYLNPLAVTLDQDRTIGSSYRETTFWEDVGGAAADVGDFFSELARKTTGMTTMLVGEVLFSIPPVGFATAAVGALGAANLILQAIGVDTGDFDDFAEKAAETMTWLQSSYTCMGKWGLDDGRTASQYGEDDSDDTADDEDEEPKTPLEHLSDSSRTAAGLATSSTTKVAGVVDKTARTAIRTNNIAGDFASARKSYKASLTLKDASKKAGAAGNVLIGVSVGVDVYTIASEGGAHWAENPNRAWSDPSVFVGCVEDSLPEYLGINTDQYVKENDFSELYELEDEDG